MMVPKLNKDSGQSTIQWNANLQQVCPADKMVTQSASFLIPTIYESLNPSPSV